MEPNNNEKALKYNEVISSQEEFTGEKFRQILESHGISVIDKGDDMRQLRIDNLDGKGTYPQIYVDVPLAGHNFDKLLLAEIHGNRRTPAAVAAAQATPIEQRLRFLNSILASSGYVGSKITLDMLNSDEKFSLTPGEKAMRELERYKENATTRAHTAQYFFNNPDGEGERQQERDKRMSDNFRIAETALKEEKNFVIGKDPELTEQKTTHSTPAKDVDVKEKSTIHITAVVGGQSIDMSLNSQQQQKLMAVDDSHRMKMLDRMLPDAGIGKMNAEQKDELQKIVKEKLFGPPSVFVSHVVDNSVSERRSPSPQITPAAMASANYEAEIKSSTGETQERNVGVGR